ncbi:MAG: aminopeptidase N [Aestuariivita sp.]|nr:aminopeptidase N [Aestuariivita sp.]MCY4203219.1 aminopeptidase N [Aestuariivita sp.]
MQKTPPQTVYLKDYQPFGYCLDKVELEFELNPQRTLVKNRMEFRPNPSSDDSSFFLHGENLKLLGAALDGTSISPLLTESGLTCEVPNQPFCLETLVEINPAANTALEGLYMSNGMYCTQCEAEGFRKITYFPDRPDVMTAFSVRITGVEDHTPILLSNGNLMHKGTDASGRNLAIWQDPWPKPCYLFALVAGDLVAHEDSFVTASGRPVQLRIWVRHGDEHKCAFAMSSLKAAMRWDEEAYGREYDLNEFNIVAVDDFNAGAMENKGLNIFNAEVVLATPETATDTAFEQIEGIIAHEYFHNWTGNRITCRDWFQLCLKEGLTVFRDSEFTASMRSQSVKRINDAIFMRGRQFPEDQGPLAHPVRPEAYREINNLYTATVYEKGAEVIGMLKRLVGNDTYRKALDLYFSQHDSEACTIEDWLAVFETTTGRDLSQFKLWYSQAGTPVLKVEEAWNDGTYTLTFKQHIEPSAATPNPKPHVIPILVGLLDPSGQEVVPTTLLAITEQEQNFEFGDLSAKPIPSILRNFSAPVMIERESNHKERAFLLAHDTDPFTRWDAGRALAQDTLIAMITRDAHPNQDYLSAIRAIMDDTQIEPACKALLLKLPDYSNISNALARAGLVLKPTKIWQATQDLKLALARHCENLLYPLHAATKLSESYIPNAEQSGKRELGAVTLSLISCLDGGKLASEQFALADNLTLQIYSLGCLIEAGSGEKQVAAFYHQWQHDRLVRTKWFALQVMKATPQNAVRVAAELTVHDDFNWRNPNIFRSVFSALVQNAPGFHSSDGAGYDFLAHWLGRLDAINPQVAARMCSAFQSWRDYDADRQTKMQAAMNRILSQKDVSVDTQDMLNRILAN